MKSKYQPTEAEIQLVLKKANWDARKLAIAYLKATHRAKAKSSSRNFMDELTEYTKKYGGAGQ